MHTLLRDLRLGVRLLRQRPRYVAVAVITMAVGLGSVTTILSAVDAVLLRKLPYREPDSLVQVFSRFRPRPNMDTVSVTPANYGDWRQTRAFTGMAAFRLSNLTVVGDGPAERIRASYVEPQLFDVLGVSAVIGRTLRASDDGRGTDLAVVVSDGLWKRRFGGHAYVIGQHLRTPDGFYTIVGVMRPSFRFPIGWTGTTDIDVWMPLTLSASEQLDRRATTLNVIARLAPGVTLSGAQADLDAVAARLEVEHPATNKDWGAHVMALSERGISDFRPMFKLLLTAVGILLAIACVNVANLLLARGIERRGELTIHAALGASRPQLLRALLIEGALVAALGGLVGLMAAWWGIEALRLIAPVTQIPELRAMTLSWSVLTATMVVAGVTGLICAAVPAFSNSRVQLRDAFDERGRVGPSRRGRRARATLVVGELTLTFLLVAAAALVVRGYRQFMAVDPGFDPVDAISMRVSVQGSRYSSPAAWTSYFEQLRDDLARLPGVESVALAASVPMGGTGEVSRYRIVGAEAATPSAPGPMGMELNRVSAGFFDTAGMHLRRGRSILDSDSAGAVPVAVVNEAFVKRALGSADPLGRYLVLQGDMNRNATAADAGAPIEIVGVVQDVKEYGLHGMTPPAVYVPVRQHPVRTLSVLVRAPRDFMPKSDVLRERLHHLDPNQPALRIESLAEGFERAHAYLRFQTVLLAAAAGIAVLLALVGLFGVVSYAAGQQDREWALRLALGARRAAIFTHVFRRALTLALAGLLIGLGSAPAVLALIVRMLKTSMNVDLPAATPALWFQASLILIVVAVAAGVLPAWRAMGRDPAAVLRNE